MTRKWNELPQLAKALRNVRTKGILGPIQPCPSQLSPECLDLLNRIFVVDHEQRITVEEIRAHPWFLKPLSPRFQAAWDHLQSRQAQFETKLRKHTMDRVRCYVEPAVLASSVAPRRCCKSATRRLSGLWRRLHRFQVARQGMCACT